MFTKRIAAMAVTLMVGCCGVGAFGAGYKAISLDVPGDYVATASAINDKGQIAIGHSGNTYIWDKGTMSLALENASPRDINNAGDVLESRDAEGKNHSEAIMLHNGVVTQLGALPGWDYSIAYAINNLGQAVGNCEKEVYTTDGMPAFIWENGQMTNLSTDMPGGYAIAMGLNDLGQVVGHTGNQAFVWNDGVMSELESLPDRRGGGALDINNNGDIAGFAHTENEPLPAMWIDGHLNLLPMLTGFSSGRASMINDSGLVVGTITTDERLTRWVYWQDGVCQLLPTLGGSVCIALGMNNTGQIVGWSSDRGGTWHATLWEPVPEPSSIFALITGLVGIGGIAIGRKK